MFGTFQQSHLRIEVDAAGSEIRENLVRLDQLSQWMWPQRFSVGLPDEITKGTVFKSYLGPIEIQHQVVEATENRLHLLLSGGVDGFHEWHWGDGWVQCRLEGISPLPLNLSQSFALWRLRQKLGQTHQAAA